MGLTSEHAREAGAIDKTPRLIAFYLPQFHPIPENDEWWGAGFTEWRNVMKAKPLFPGHYQPHMPGELGFYDLRVPEVREAQAALARQFGIYGFCYYHYWFHGRRLLEAPFNDVLESGTPDLPFALCWANEDWTRNWDARTGSILVQQRHSPEDDLAHIRWLLEAFGDSRYIKVDGRPLMLVYRVKQLLDPKRMTDLWRSEAQKAGFPDLYLCKVESHGDYDDPEAVGFDASVAFLPRGAARLLEPFAGFREHTVLDYAEAVAIEQALPPTPFKRIPTVMTNWDNTPRRKSGAVIFSGSTPEAYERWLRSVVQSTSGEREEDNLVFVMAWNEWAEGNHLEPDERYGRRYLEATSAALGLAPGGPTSSARERDASAEAALVSAARDVDESYAYRYEYAEESALGHIVTLARDLIDPERAIVDLGAGAGVISRPLNEAGFRYHGMDSHPVSLRLMKEAGIDASACDLNDPDDVLKKLDQLETDIGALLLIDVIEHLVDPHLLLSELSRWAREHGSSYLLVSVPNVAHFDIAFRLLCGRWDPTRTGLLDSTHVRFFYRDTLARLFDRAGWKLVEENDFHVLRSDQYSEELINQVPASVFGALRVLSESYNPSATVQQYVWALAPVDVDSAPSSYFDAVGDDHSGLTSEAETEAGLLALSDYMSSVGVFTLEQDRRSLSSYRKLEDYCRELEGRIARDEEELKRRDEYAEVLNLRLQTVESQFQVLEQEIDSKEAYIQRAGAHMVELESSLQKADTFLRENEAYVRGIESALETAHADAASALEAAKVARAETEAYVRKLESALSEADSARAETESYVRKVEAALDETKSEAEFALHEAWTRAGHLEGERDVLRTELEQVSFRLTQAEAKTQELESLVQAIRNRKAYRVVAGVIDLLPVRRA